jgi:hypothetical protein
LLRLFRRLRTPPLLGRSDILAGRTMLAGTAMALDFFTPRSRLTLSANGLSGRRLLVLLLSISYCHFQFSVFSFQFSVFSFQFSVFSF